MTQLYLVRHPRPQGTAGRCYGRSDVSVDLESVSDAARTVRECIPHPVLRAARIFSSPSTRCVLLARELARPRAPTLVDELHEMSFGAWEGQCWDALPRAEIDAWAQDVWGYRPGGAESAAMVAERWRRWSACVVASTDEAAIAVTHAGVIRVALSCAGRLSAASMPEQAIEFGSVHRLDLARCVS